MTWHLECNNKKFHSKLDAIKENINSGQPINYVTPQSYLAHDFTTRNSQTLEELCVAQAVKLRSEYKNINLFYSGGCDSHYMLKTFIDNGIKIDKIIMVKSGFRSADFEIEKRDNPKIKTVSFDPPKEAIQYVKIIAKKVGPVPDWHIGSSHDGRTWIFIDEILIDYD